MIAALPERCVAKVLLDTNVWVDYYIARGDRHDEVASLINECIRAGAVLYVSSLSLKDLYFVVEQDMKRTLREAGRPEGDGSLAAAARETAWACVSNVLDLALVVPVGLSETLMAFSNRRFHDDYEDDLVLASAQKAQVDFIVTSDALFARDCPLCCVSVEEARERVGRLGA